MSRAAHEFFDGESIHEILLILSRCSTANIIHSLTEGMVARDMRLFCERVGWKIGYEDYMNGNHDTLYNVAVAIQKRQSVW